MKTFLLTLSMSLMNRAEAMVKKADELANAENLIACQRYATVSMVLCEISAAIKEAADKLP